MAKVDMRREDASPTERAATWRAAAEGLAAVLRLLHPLMPFITEELWQALADTEPELTAGEPLLIRAAWPEPGQRDPAAEAAFADLAELIRAVRNLRTESRTPAAAWSALVIDTSDGETAARLRTGLAYVEALARARPIEIGPGEDRPELVAATPFGAAWLPGDATGASDLAARRSERLTEIDLNLDRLRRLLTDEAFAQRAPAAVVARERERLAELEERRRQLLAEA